MRRAFSLVELLVVIAILAILVGILFPVFARARASAKQSTCLSNLKQIGAAMTLYMADYDDMFPAAVDASDRFAPGIWSDFPEFQARIPSMPLMHEALQPYAKSAAIFRCPSDQGTRMLDSNFPTPFPAQPTLFQVYGSSYFFRTEIAFRSMSQTSLELPADVNVMFDGGGHWHGSTRGLAPDDGMREYFDKTRGFRYNVLFGDMHAKSRTFDGLQRAWDTPLGR